MGIRDADHEETAPGAQDLVIHKLVCSLVGTTGTVRLLPGTLARRVYGRDESTEQFRCSYGFNPAYRDRLEAAGMKVSGVDPSGEARIIELAGCRFYLATLFVPQLSSTPERPHPLILEFLRAAAESA